MKKYLKPLSGLAGIILAVWLIMRLGPGRIAAELYGGLWQWFPAVLLAYTLQQFLGSFALWILGTRKDGPGWQATGVLRLAGVRYVGEVLNYALPTGTVGGEPYKYLVLRKGEGDRPAFQALITAKFLHLSAIGPFTAMVFIAAAMEGIGGRQWHSALIITSAIALAATTVAWSMLLWHGIGRWLFGGFFRIRHWLPHRVWGIRRFLHGDRLAAVCIRQAPARAALAFICYVGMWASACLEWLAIALLLGLPWRNIGLIGAGLFECVSIIVGGVMPVPAGVGTQEAGKVALAHLLGLEPGVGLAMSLIRRAREICMIATGLIFGLIISRDQRL